MRFMLAAMPALLLGIGGLDAQGVVSVRERVAVRGHGALTKSPEGVYFYFVGYRIGEEVFVRIDRCIDMGLEPFYEAEEGLIALRATGWHFECRVGSTEAKVNGRAVALPIPPRLLTAERAGEEGETPRPYIPMITVALLLGYDPDLVPTPSAGETHMDLTLTYPFTGPMQDFFRQHIAPASRGVHRSGEIEIESSPLRVQRLWPAGWEKHCYGAGVSLSVTNHGEALYYASNRFVRLEMWDGRHFGGRDVTGCAENAALVAPGGTDRISVYPILFSANEATPIKRLIYMDGLRRFEWAIEPAEPRE